MTEPTNTKGNILLVDDLLDNLQLLSDLLIKLDYTVRKATSGRMALKTIKIKQPDIILLDVKMPEMNGYQVCQAIKADPDFSDMPIIFISALDEPIDKIKAFESGGVDYITKPFHVEEVVARVENQLTIQRQKRALKEEIIKRQEFERFLRQYERIVSATTDAISLVDRNYIYRVVNQTYLNWHHKSNEEIIGHSVSDLVGETAFQTIIKERLDLGLQGEPIQYEEWFEFNDHKHRFVRVKYLPYIEIDGTISGVVVNINDLTDMKHTEIALAEAKKAAEVATKAKSEFLANMSHEIRTPMNGVLGMTELLATTNLTNQQKAFIQTIQDSGETLLTIINDILDFSKIESRMIELEAREFVIEELLQSVCNLFQKEARTKNIDLQYVIQSDLPNPVLADSYRLRQILLNLVGNAIKFTNNGAVSIVVNSKALPQNDQYELTFAVKDTGIGIKRDRVDKLFQAFTQADSSVSRNYGGTGLGLTICKYLIELMGGKIWVESADYICYYSPEVWVCDLKTNPLEEGANFYFTMTVSPVSSQSEKLDQTTLTIDASIAEQFPLRILLVEDNLINQKVAYLMLKQLGYEVDVANNGIEAIKAVRNQVYDLLFMDVQMPEMDGLTATREIRQNLTIQPQIIAMTANVLEEDHQACLDAGMNDHISKPINFEELIQILSQSYARSRFGN